MQISREFQGFTFGKLWNEVSQIEQVIWFDVGSVNFPIRPKGIKRDSLRNLIKQLDPNYPKDENGRGLSYRDITTKELDSHLIWIYSTFADSGYEWKD